MEETTQRRRYHRHDRIRKLRSPFPCQRERRHETAVVAIDRPHDVSFKNPNVIDAADGTTIIAKTDPEGPVERWQEVGAEWGQLEALGEMQSFYPDPPLLLWVNNFEQPRLRWGEAETSWRYVQAHGTQTTDEQKRGIVGQGWVERDGALFAALRAQLTPAWRDFHSRSTRAS